MSAAFFELPPPPPAHTFSALEQVLFGQAAEAVLPEQVERLAARRVFAISSPSVARGAAFRRLQEALGPRWAGSYTGVLPFSPRDCVLEGAAAARAAGADLLLAVGGGSVIDSTKVMLLCLRHGLTTPEQLDPYAEAAPEPSAGPWLRMVAVPTTFSAAEYTPRGGATDPATRKLEAFSAPPMMPRVVVNDPAFTLGTPLPTLLATGMKAVDHAVERLTSRHANAYSDAVSAVALRYLACGLPALRAQPDDLGLRAGLQYGVYLSMCGRNAGVNAGLSHAIGHQLGTFSGVSHGETSCLLLPAVLRWIGDARPGCQRMVSEALGQDGDDAGGAVLALASALGLTTRLRDAGVRREDLPELAQRTLRDPLVRNCPREVRGAGDVLEVLESAW